MIVISKHTSTQLMNFLAGAFVSVALNFLTAAGLFSVVNAGTPAVATIAAPITVAADSGVTAQPTGPAQPAVNLTPIMRQFVQSPVGTGLGATIWFAAAICVSVWANFIEKAEKRASLISTASLSQRENEAILESCLREVSTPIMLFGILTLALFAAGVFILLLHL